MFYKVTYWEGCISANTSSTEEDAFQPIPHQLCWRDWEMGIAISCTTCSQLVVSIRWKLLKHCISLRSCPSKIVATIQAIVIIMCCRCTHTHTTFNISGLVPSLVPSLVQGEQQKVKDKGALGFLLLFSHLMVHSSCVQNAGKKVL